MDDSTVSRVLYVTTTSDTGGAEQLLASLIDGLDRSRFLPVLLSLCPLGRIGRRVRDSGVPTISLGLSQEASALEMPRAARALARVMREEEIALVHSQLYRANFLSPLASRLVNPRPVTVLAQHSLYSMTGRYAETLTGLASRLADRVVAVSEGVAAYVRERLGVRPDRVVVIPNGVDPERFRPGEGGGTRHALGVAADALLVGVVGRLSREKGVDLLLDAAPEICREVPRVRFAVVGDGCDREWLTSRAASLGLASRFLFLGARSDVAEIYRALDVFVLPSRREAAPMALLEAMASGCPVVAVDAGSVSGIVGEAGVVVPPESPDAIATGVIGLAHDAARAASMGSRARKRAIGANSLGRSIELYSDLYASLLDGRRATAER